MHAFLIRLIHPTRASQKVYLVCKYAGFSVTCVDLEIFAFTDLEATDPKYDDVKILTRSRQGKLIAIPIKVSVVMNILFSQGFQVVPSPSDKKILSGN
jgi:hypothetical protein